MPSYSSLGPLLIHLSGGVGPPILAASLLSAGFSRSREDKRARSGLGGKTAGPTLQSIKLNSIGACPASVAR
jgi:hypothetical protein